MATELSKLPQDPSVPTQGLNSKGIPENIKLETTAYKNDLDAKPSMPPIADTKQLNSMVSEVQNAAAQGLTRLAEDIPKQTTQVLHDPQTIPNAIPNAMPNAQANAMPNAMPNAQANQDTTTPIDYIQNHATQQEIEAELNKHKNKETTVEYILEELKFPLLIAFLYGLFHSSIFKNIILTKAPAFVYTSASGFTSNGNIYMSALFGIALYIILKVGKVLELNVL
jgi:hypothetical protein